MFYKKYRAPARVLWVNYWRCPELLFVKIYFIYLNLAFSAFDDY